MTSNEIEREIGRRLRWLRRVRGMTQEALAAPCGVSFQQIQKYETAAARISAGMLLRFAQALNVEVWFFCDGLGQLPNGKPGQARLADQSRRGGEEEAGKGACRPFPRLPAPPRFPA